MSSYQNCPHFDNKLEIFKLNPYKYSGGKTNEKIQMASRGTIYIIQEDKILKEIINSQMGCNH